MRQSPDAFKVEAANAILARLGDDAFTSLKHDLFRNYGIILEDRSSYTLADLETALQDLLGADAERFLIREILKEIALLDSESTT